MSKYLIIAKPTPIQSGTIDPKKLLEMLKASKEYVKPILSQGRAECIYSFPEGGGVGIANTDSHERMANTINGYPFTAYFQWEIRPLCDFNKVIEDGIAALKKRIK